MGEEVRGKRTIDKGKSIDLDGPQTNVEKN